jgi:hypothetical protein
VSIGVNETTKTIHIPLCGDLLREPTETINLALNGGPLGFPSNAVLNVNDTANQFRNTVGVCTTQGSSSMPYPSTMLVAGGPLTIGALRVSLYDLNHQLPDNMDVLLVSPSGAKFILMADAGGSASMSGIATLTFDDLAGAVLPDSGPLTTGAYEPTSWESGQSSFPLPAPPAPYVEPGSAVGGNINQTLNGNFRLTNANGIWSLYIRDDSGNPVNSCVNGGWGLEVLASTAAPVSIAGRVSTAGGNGIRNAKIVVTGNSLAEPRIATTGTFGHFSIEGLASGETYVVTVNSQRYTFSTPSRVVSLVDNIVDMNFIADPEE